MCLAILCIVGIIVSTSQRTQNICNKRNENVTSVSHGTRDVCNKRDDNVTSVSQGTHDVCNKRNENVTSVSQGHVTFLIKEMRYHEYLIDNGDPISFICKHICDCVYM